MVLRCMGRVDFSPVHVRAQRGRLNLSLTCRRLRVVKHVVHPIHNEDGDRKLRPELTDQAVSAASPSESQRQPRQDVLQRKQGNKGSLSRLVGVAGTDEDGDESKSGSEFGRGG